ncbi:MAG: hypothetical protein V4510_10065 [bacterium]
MNGISAIAGKDVLILDGQILTGYADGDAIKCEPQGPISQYKVSKDGNTIVALQYTGILVKLSVRLVRACFDDQVLNGKLQQWIADPASFALMAGSYVKRVGDGKGATTNEVYQLAGGVFETIPAGHSNMDGSTEQAVTVYTLFFRNDARLMQ